MKLGRLRLFGYRAIGEPDVFLRRWVLLGWGEGLGLYLHQFVRSDHDRALHDHPWPFLAWILKGGYWEVHDQTTDRSEVKMWRAPGQLLVRSAEWRHRIELRPGTTSWSLVVVFPRERRWGFYPSTGWCWWRTYNVQHGICEDQILYPGGED
jgi:hypothetical protein